MKIRAELKEKMPIQTFGEADKEFRKQTCIFTEVEPEVEYPNTVAIDFSGDNLILVDAMNLGSIYDVNFNISCKKTDKGGIFNTVRGRKVKEVGSTENKKDDTDIPF